MHELAQRKPSIEHPRRNTQWRIRLREDPRAVRCYGSGMAETLSFAHLSDPHLTSPAGVAPRDLLGKRALGYLSWRLRRRAHHREAVLTALLRDLTERDVDHVVVTGDLTNLGLPAELAEARRWLTRVGPPARLMWCQAITTRTRHPVRLGIQHPSDDRCLEGVSHIGRAAADARRRPLPGGSHPRAGHVHRAQQRPALAGVPRHRHAGSAAARAAGRRSGIRAAGASSAWCCLHHPVLPGTVRWRKRLTDASALRAVLAWHGAELVLLGHSHRTSVQLLDAAPGPIPIVGVPSASAETADVERGARYHVSTL